MSLLFLATSIHSFSLSFIDSNIVTITHSCSYLSLTLSFIFGTLLTQELTRFLCFNRAAKPEVTSDDDAQEAQDDHEEDEEAEEKPEQKEETEAQKKQRQLIEKQRKHQAEKLAEHKKMLEVEEEKEDIAESNREARIDIKDI